LALDTDLHTKQKRKGLARPRIHWCLTGAFAFVPVHAAGIYEGAAQECCSDYMVSSYTPTLSALLRAREGQQTFTPAQISLVGVAAEHSHNPSMPRLCHVSQEVQDTINIVHTAGATASSEADHLAVLAMIQLANMVHLACHGIQHSTDPHQSRFCLRTGDLTVSELMDTDLKHAFFAFLSACETAKGDPKHADEAVHLAATMLFAGFKSVVATMW
jgi:CHAT domain-containing protein